MCTYVLEVCANTSVPPAQTKVPVHKVCVAGFVKMIVCYSLCRDTHYHGACNPIFTKQSTRFVRTLSSRDSSPDELKSLFNFNVYDQWGLWGRGLCSVTLWGDGGRGVTGYYPSNDQP